MSGPPPSDFAVDLALAKSGDRAALERILIRVHDQLLAEAERLLGDRLRARTRASDVTQDACVEVVNRIGNFKGTTLAEFFVWARAILENCARQESRRLMAQKRRTPSRTSQLGELARAIMRTPKTPFSEAVSAEQQKIIDAAFRSLRDDHRMVIGHIKFKLRPVADVASDLSRSEAATRMLLHRALTAFEQELRRRTRDDEGGAGQFSPA